MQNNNKIHRVDPDKNVLETNGQTDRWMDKRTELLPQRWRFDHVFQKFENKIFINYLVWLWHIGKAVWKESIQEKGRTSAVFSVQRVQQENSNS